MPLASMSNVTSICGTPRGAGGMSVEVELAERAVVARHRALALEHVDLDARSGCRPPSRRSRSCCVGIVVLRAISVVITPPSVSMPSDSGVTSSSSRSFTSPASTPAWIAAPIGDDFVRVHALVRFLAEELLDDLLHASGCASSRRRARLRRSRSAVTPASFSACLHRADASSAAGRRPAARTSRA